MTGSSRLAGFYEQSLDQRVETVAAWAGLTTHEVVLLRQQGLDAELGSHMIENVIGTIELPLGIAVNMIVNGRDYLVPMAVEEASVIAAASRGAKLARHSGGFRAKSGAPAMIGQVQVLDVPDPVQACQRLTEESGRIIDAANRASPSMVRRGGGATALTTTVIEGTTGRMLIVHVLFGTGDAMGANLVNNGVEAAAPLIAEVTGGRINLRIVSNLADRRLVTASCRIPVIAFGESGAAVAKRIVEASDLASLDPYRAVTNNKGVLNAINAVCLATANDWRAVEAAAHAHACRHGRYGSLTTWRLDDRAAALLGDIEVPIPVGTVGGATSAHPVAQVALKILGTTTAAELAQVMVATALAENLASLLALVTEGIQKGHMRLHARQIAITAGARGGEISRVASRMVEDGQITVRHARDLLAFDRGDRLT